MSFPKKKTKQKQQHSDYDGGLHVLPAPEEIELGKWYTFNLNPIDNLQSYGKNAMFRMNTVHHKMTVELATFIAPYCDYKLQQEFSCKGRLHYHGRIRFKAYNDDEEDTYRNVRLFYLTGMQHIQAYSSMCIEPITDEEGWDEYVEKGSHLYSKILEIKSTDISKKQKEEFAKVANFEDAYGNLKNAK
jgi:hypothetical protein